MKGAIVELLSSKKFLTAIVALLVAGGARYGLALDPEVCATILGLFAVLIGAQGAADQGKAAAEIHANSMASEPLPMPRGDDEEFRVVVEPP